MSMPPPQIPAAPLVLCLGEALVDRLYLPDGDRLGGAPANVACALARLGTPSAFLGRLGRDAIGQAFAAVFAERGVDTSALQWDARRPSRVVLVRRDASGDRQFGGFAAAADRAGAGDGGMAGQVFAGEGFAGEVFADQALDASELSAALGPLLATARWLLVGTIPLASPAAASALLLACRQAAAAGVALALDVNWRPTFWNPAADPASGPTPAQIAATAPLLQQAALIKCAAEEARWLFGSDDPAVVSAALPQHPDLVVTDGGAPLRWCFAGCSGELPAFRVPVVDTTGAGDAFTAGLLHSQLHNQSHNQVHNRVHSQPEQRLCFASACGALVCQGAGAIDPQPSADAVQAFLASHA
jgi:fructokinase